MNPVTASAAIRAALRDVAIRVWHQTTPITEHGQGAAWAVGEFRRIVAEEPDTWFDRYLCPDPCGTMHTRCAGCGKPVDGCPHEQPAAVSAPAPAPTEGLALQRAADALWALANRTTERGAGVLWAADWLRDRAVALAVPESVPTDDAPSAEHHTVDGVRHLCHADDHYCPPASGSGRVADETRAERPRCPHCRMPHDLTPEIAAVCASIRASIAEQEAQQPECTCDPAPHREEDGTYSHWAGCPIADAQQAADEAQQTEKRQACHCGQDGCEYCDVDDEAEDDEERQTEEPSVVCEGFVWIGQSFATCDRCAQPAWDHQGEEVAVEGAGPFDTRRTVRPWKPGQADRIRAKWAPAVVSQPDGEA